VSRSLRHGALAATAIVFSIASLAACGAGNDAATLKVRPDNAATTVGDIRIQNANIVTQPERTATGPASVVATLFNNGTKPQTLEAVTLPNSSASVQLHAAEGAGPVVVPAGGSVLLGGPGNASAVIENGSEAAQAGNVQRLVFKFSAAGEVPLGAAVVPATGYFTGFGPSTLPETPEKSPATKPTGSASATPSGSEGGAPAQSESDTVTPTDSASASTQAH
jgi:copper(I)-binding protein